jgi:hypothetical protein
MKAGSVGFQRPNSPQTRHSNTALGLPPHPEGTLGNTETANDQCSFQ